MLIHLPFQAQHTVITRSIYFDGARVRKLQTMLSSNDRLLVGLGGKWQCPTPSQVTLEMFISQKSCFFKDVNIFTANEDIKLPCAMRQRKRPLLGSHVEVASLQIYRVNGQRWKISMDSLVGIDQPYR